jgi:hypothetical protein
MFEVEDEFAGREEFAVGMERSGCCRALLWGEGLTNAQPREGEPDGGHRGAESLGGVGGGLGDGLLLGWLWIELGWLLAGVVGSVVVAVDIGTWNLLGELDESPTAKTADRLVAARAWKSPWLVTVLEAYGGRLAIEATMEPPVTEGG